MIKRDFHHFHDYYSRTYPRYESYTSKERERDLYCMMKTISENDNRRLVQEIYYTPTGQINPVFRKNVLCAVGDSISSDLSGPIIQEVIMILSGPEATLALSAPVVNIVTHSEEIHADQITVVGKALSAGALSTQIVAGVGNAISSDELSTQMFVATEKVLSNDEISSAMIKPVSNVVPTDPVGEAVAKEVNKRVTIEKIIGNDSLKFRDMNNDNIPDEYQEPPVTTIIWGGLGA